jgi:iron complex outermembrane recepter protein
MRGRSRHRVTISALAVAIGLGAIAKAQAQLSPSTAPAVPAPSSPASPAAPAPAPSTNVPEIVVSAPKTKPPVRHRPRTAARSTAPVATAAPAAPAPAATGAGGTANAQAPLEQAAASDKTGTKLGDLPQSVVVVPRSVVSEQGGTSLSDAVRDVSGVNLGGSSSYGFFDRFTIRGMDARIYSDGFPDGDQFNGFSHSMNGVQSIEVLKGPGSALFGSTTPGGSINIIHFMPSATPGYGISEQIGSFGSWMTSVYATGPTTVPGLTYRVDGLFQHSDGFRDISSGNYEFRPEWSWKPSECWTRPSTR